MRVVVIGNGVVALSAAFRLLERLGPTDEVSIVGPSARPGSASLAAGAMLGAFSELEADGLKTEAQRAHFDAGRRAAKDWPRFLKDIVGKADAEDELAEGPWLAHGTYVVDNGEEEDQRNLDAILFALQAHDEPHDVVAPSDIPGFSPRNARTRRALFLPKDGWVNPRFVMALLERALRQDARVRFIDDEAVRLTAAGGHITKAVLKDGHALTGDRFLAAAGAHASRVLDGLDLPIQPVLFSHGVSLELETSVTACVRTPNRAMGGVYVTPYFTRSEKRVLLGSFSFVSASPQVEPPEGAIAALLRSAAEELDERLEGARVLRVNFGARPLSLDGFPLVGGTSLPNLAVATGTYRTGFHLAPVLSAHLAAAVLGEPGDPRLALFHPERNPL